MPTAITSDSMHNQNCHAYLLVLQPHCNKLIEPIRQLSEKYQEDVKLKKQSALEKTQKIKGIAKPKELLKESKDLLKQSKELLKQIQVATKASEKLMDLLKGLNDIRENISEEYNASKEGIKPYPYGDLYSRFITALEESITLTYGISEEQDILMNNLIHAIYHNDNKILEPKRWQALKNTARPQSNDTSNEIKHRLKDKESPINKISPYKADTISANVSSLFSANFDPLASTNIPTIRYGANENLTEYRFCTQAQRHNNEVRINPLFIRWLEIRALQSSQAISHIYFNNLGWDRSNFDIAGKKEKKLTACLHQLNSNPVLKTAVITLPANESLMNADHYQMTKVCLPYRKVFAEFLEVAQGRPHSSGVSDFYISPNIKELLFKEKPEKKQLEALLKESFKKLGITEENSKISKAQKQAVWLHFIKFELTNYILETLKPNSYNFSCKDAIDRGAVSSAYYNLMKSFELKQPMQQEEFENALDAAAANVKGRGMNYQRKIIWNALDCYIEAQHRDLLKDPKKAWLIYWRDMNCPYARAHQLLDIRAEQCLIQFSSLPEEHPLKNAGTELISAIQKLQKEKVSGQRLLLELTARTSNLLNSEEAPSAVSLKEYDNLIKELKVNYPILQIIAGLAKAFLGALLYLPSFSHSESLITAGIATAKAGFFASESEAMGKKATKFADDCLKSFEKPSSKT